MTDQDKEQGGQKQGRQAPSGKYTYSAEAGTFTGEDGQQYEYQPGKGLILVGG